MRSPKTLSENLRCRCRGHGSPEIIDPCIRELVDCLNRHGVQTVQSCCGHGVIGGVIILAPEAIEHGKRGHWVLKLNVKPVVLPYSDKTCDWEDEYPKGGRNLSEVNHAMDLAEHESQTEEGT